MPKVKYVLLLPLTYNDGTSVPKIIRDRIEEEIYILAGGFRYGAAGRGAYRMRNGEKQVDVTQELWIVVNQEDEEALMGMVAQFAMTLRQETLYLERTDGSVEFVPPSRIGRLSK